ncbi:hypothetical protein QTP86_016343 [Hemibagrus guttatus]|nr:hypothetical protein QTP86_016343 [Hemibagrus guttatus]
MSVVESAIQIELNFCYFTAIYVPLCCLDYSDLELKGMHSDGTFNCFEIPPREKPETYHGVNDKTTLSLNKLAVYVEFAGHLVGNKIDDAEGQNHFARTFCDKCFKCVKQDILLGPALRGRVISERPGRDVTEGPGSAAAPDLTESEHQAQPAAQKPIGATPAPEKPRTAKPAAAEPHLA